MLVQLTARSVVLFERMALELQPGFNVLTGETGAGKSMILDAFALVLGGRAHSDIVRAGEPEAEVEALFEIEPGSRVAAKLEAAGVPCAFEGGKGELVIRRVVQAGDKGDKGDKADKGERKEKNRDARSRAFVNGRLCTAAQLAELAADLCDVSSQHESVSLTDPATHMEYLDAFGKLASARDALGEDVDALGAIAKELQEVRAAERGRAEREDFLAYQLREIGELEPTLGEETELENERGRLRHAGRLAEVTRRASERLYEGEGAICDELARLSADVDAASELDPSLAPLARTLESSRAELADAARALGRYAEGVESNPSRLAEVDERLFRLQKLLRKHGPTTAELLAHHDALKKELETMSSASDRVAALERDRDAKLARVATAARALSKKRREAADKLADAIGRELASLGMGRARVVVDVAPTQSSGESLNVDGARLQRSGIDRVEFLIAPNKGEDPRPLRRIASGGELSRALLALKRVLADRGPAGLYVFDEVDAGVGGAVAEVIGRSIAEIAKHRQVLCITHLPQIAALAETQFVVGKLEAKGRTSSTVRRLGEEERVEELARMIGGVKVGDAARRTAEEMMRARFAEK
jgi:DNA repair protein RecN (Recombination protein N)